MPRGDRTGPDGRGPMTGRRAGYCAGYNVPGHMNSTVPPRGGLGPGRGFRRGFRGGRGGGRGPYPPASPDVEIPPPVYGPAPAPEQEVEYLEATAEQLERELKAIKDRIKELAKSKKE